MGACKKDCWEYLEFYVHNGCKDTVQFIAPYSHFGKFTLSPDSSIQFFDNKIGCDEDQSKIHDIPLNVILKDTVTVLFSDSSSIKYIFGDTTQKKSPMLLENYTRDGHYKLEYTITEADHEAAKAAGVR